MRAEPSISINHSPIDNCNSHIEPLWSQQRSSESTENYWCHHLSLMPLDCPTPIVSCPFHASAQVSLTTRGVELPAHAQCFIRALTHNGFHPVSITKHLLWRGRNWLDNMLNIFILQESSTLLRTNSAVAAWLCSANMTPTRQRSATASWAAGLILHWRRAFNARNDSHCTH